MGDEHAIRARLAAFANGIDWPSAEHIETEGDPERGWQGPYIAGTFLPVGIVGWNLADDWAGCQPFYPGVTEAQRIAARDYYLAHADLFQAQRWRAVNFDKRYRPGGDGDRLQNDVAALLALLDVALLELAAARALNEWACGELAAALNARDDARGALAEAQGGPAQGGEG